MWSSMPRSVPPRSVPSATPPAPMQVPPPSPPHPVVVQPAPPPSSPPPPQSQPPQRNLALIGRSLTSFQTLPEYKRGLPDTLITLNLHCNNISTLTGLSVLSQLVDLNLSSNCIEIMDAGELSTLRKLKRLNLASNVVRRVGGLSFLLQLEDLNLSHNRITSLGGLNQLTNSHVLAELDLRDNRIADLQELNGLDDIVLSTLRTLQLRDASSSSKSSVSVRQVRPEGNVVCKRKGYVAAVRRLAPNITSLDGTTMEMATATTQTRMTSRSSFGSTTITSMMTGAWIAQILCIW